MAVNGIKPLTISTIKNRLKKDKSAKLESIFRIMMMLVFVDNQTVKVQNSIENFNNE